MAERAFDLQIIWTFATFPTLTNGDFSSGETGWGFIEGIVHSVSGGKLLAYRNGGAFASFYQDLAFAVSVGDTFTVSVDVANTSAGDKDIRVSLHDVNDVDDWMFEERTILASAAEDTLTFNFTATGSWDQTRFEIYILTDDNLAELTFDNISVSWTTTQATNVTTDVREIHTKRGFSANPLAHMADVGTCSLILDNTSQNYSPEYTSGLHYGKQWINALIRIAYTDVLPADTVIWRGYVRSVVPEPGAYGGKRCVVYCEDVLGLYARSQVAINAENNLTMAQALNLIGAEVFKTDRATGTVTFSDRGDEDDTITIGVRTYTLKTGVSTTEYEVLIGTNATETARNLAAAINDDPDANEGTQIYGDNTFKSPQVSAAASAGGITLTALNRSTLGNSIALSVTSPHRDADTINVTASDGTSGTVADTYVANGSYFQVEEIGGATNPAFDIDVDFSGIAGTPTTFYLLGLYSGGSGHTVRVSAYNYSTPGYDNVGTIPEGVSDAEFTFTLTADHVDGSGNANIRIWHDGGGNATHYLRIDHMNIVANAAQTPLDITVSDTTLTGGTDPTNTDYDTGKRTFDVVGDRWSEERTNALRAFADVVESEFGYGFATRGGVLTAWDKDREFIFPSQKTGSIYDGETALFTGEMGDYIFNRVTVNFQPRGTTAATVIAEANNTIAVPGKTFGTRWNREVGYPSSGEADALPGGTKIVRLPFLESDTGNIVGAQDVITPRRSTDFTYNDSRDGLGYDYTNSIPPYVRCSIVVTGSGVEVTFSNTALGTLYVFDFQVRGLALIGYDNQQIVREDSTSIGIYQRQGLTYNIPLTSGEAFAEQIAIYLVNRYANPSYRVSTITLRDVQKLGFANMDIGDAFSFGEVQTGITHDYYIRSVQIDITGMQSVYALGEPGPNVSVVMGVKRIDEVTYWILGNAQYGVLGYTTRPGL